jgi:DNA-binding CsgD family transcriptional regulator/catechol 2,3-dioxygenase-like lactoylglutathione lyase family enzyme
MVVFMAPTGQRGRPRADDILTPAEWRIVEAVRHGLTSRQIAAARGISTDAVKYHVANAIQKLGLTNRKALRHWNGVARHSALHGKETSMSEIIKIGEIAQISRVVADIEAARVWYRDVLGLEHLYSFERMAFFDCGGTRLYLSQGQDLYQGQAAAPATESVLYFRVGDIRAAHAQLSARGAVFQNAPHMIHRHPDGVEEWLAILNDNEGRPLAISSQVRP